MNITIVGAGHVGLVTGACFAEIGHSVTVLDNDSARIAKLKRGLMPYYEPGLKELVGRGVRAKRLSFTTSMREGVERSTVIFIAVGTPQKAGGEADLTYVESVARSIAQHLRDYRLVVEKSTVPVQTGHWIDHTIKTYLKTPRPFDVASNPEFLREGSAIQDFMKPDRVVLGVQSERAKKLLCELYKPLGAPIVVTDIASAELIKHASNSFLSMKISFINAVAQVCERCGADVKQVAQGMGLDPRIGKAFLNAGIGFGGFCFDAEESAFVLNSPHLRVERFQRLFERSGPSTVIRGVEVGTPMHGHLLSFDAQQGTAAVADIRCVTRRRYRGPMVEVQTMMGRRLRVTADHPLVVADVNTQALRVSPACLVQPGDHLVSPMVFPSLRSIRALNLLERLLKDRPDLPIKLRAVDPTGFAHVYQRYGRHIPSEVCRYPHDMRRRGVMSWPTVRFLYERRRWTPQTRRIRLFTSKGRTTEIPARFVIDAAFMRWLGYYVAEGWISCEAGRGGAIRERVGFSFGRHETAYLQDLHNFFDRHGIRYQVVKFPSAVSTIVSSRLLAWFLRDVLGCGANSTQKHLPAIAFNVSPALRQALLQGLFSGDGAVTPVQNGRNVMFEYATTSRSLADGVVLLLQSLGVVPSIHPRRMNKSTCPAYIIRVSGLAQVRQLRGLFGRPRRQQIDRLVRGYQREIAQRGFIRRNGHVLLPIRRVRTSFMNGYVYSVETANELLVAGNGLVAHNCFPKDLDAFIQISGQLGYDFELLRAVRAINEQQKRAFVQKIQRALWVVKGKTIGVLGLAFKPNTDDMRYAPAIDVIEQLQAEGATIKAFDPQAMKEAAHVLRGVTLCRTPYEVARQADCLAILTVWREFQELDFARIRRLLRQPLVVDGRNLYDPARMRAVGFRYIGVGRGGSDAQPGPSGDQRGDGRQARRRRVNT